MNEKRHQSSGISSKAEPGGSNVLGNLCVVRVPQEDLSSREALINRTQRKHTWPKAIFTYPNVRKTLFGVDCSIYFQGFAAES